MKKEINVDGYNINFENKDIKNMSFKNYFGEKINVNDAKCMKVEILIRISEECSYDHEKRRHFDSYINLNDYLLGNKESFRVPSPEEIIIKNEGEELILKEIWNLPVPQNRRVYMHIVDKISLTDIAKKENRAIPVIKRSVDRGIKNLQQKLKKIYKEG